MVSKHYQQKCFLKTYVTYEAIMYKHVQDLTGFPGHQVSPVEHRVLQGHC